MRTPSSYQESQVHSFVPSWHNAVGLILGFEAHPHSGRRAPWQITHLRQISVVQSFQTSMSPFSLYVSRCAGEHKSAKAVYELWRALPTAWVRNGG